MMIQGNPKHYTFIQSYQAINEEVLLQVRNDMMWNKHEAGVELLSMDLELKSGQLICEKVT